MAGRQTLDIGMDDGLVAFPEMREHEDVACDVVGPEERSADRLRRVVGRGEYRHFGADHPFEGVRQWATVRRHHRGVVPGKTDPGKGQRDRGRRRVDLQTLAAEVLAQGADDAEETGIT